MHATPVVIRSARSTPITDLLSLHALWRNLWPYRGLIRQFIQRDVAMRHKGTALGLAWTVTQPLLTLAIYTFLFGVVFRNRWQQMPGGGASGLAGQANFTLNFFCGYVLFNVFAECVNRSPGLIIDHPNLVRKVVFPLEVLPVSAAGAALVFGAIGVVLLLIATLALTWSLPATVVFFPLVVVPLVMLTLGVAWFAASIGVFIRDVRNVVPVLTQLLFFMTPVFYPVDAVPEPYRAVLNANPLTTIVESARRTLLWGQAPDWLALGVVTAFSFIVMLLGYAWFIKSKKGLADVL